MSDEKEYTKEDLEKTLKRMDEVIISVIKGIAPYYNQDTPPVDVLYALAALESVITSMEIRLEKTGVEKDTIQACKNSGRKRMTDYNTMMEAYEDGKTYMKGGDA